MGMFENLQVSREDAKDDLPPVDDPVVSLEMEIDADFAEAEQGLALPSEIEEIQRIEGEMQNLRDVAAVAKKHGNSRALISFVNRDHGLEKVLGMEAEDIVNLEAEDLDEKITEALERFTETLSYEDAVYMPKGMVEDYFADEDLEASEEAVRDGSGKFVQPTVVNRFKAWFRPIRKRMAAAFRSPGRLWAAMKGKTPSFPSASLGVFKNIPAKAKSAADAGWMKAKGAGSAVAGASSKSYHMFVAFTMRNKIAVAVSGTVVVVGGITAFLMGRKKSVSARIKKYADSISGKSWNAEMAGEKKMKGVTEAAILKELACAKDLNKIFNAVYGQPAPMNSAEYKAWTAKVDTAMAKFTDIYGIKMNWNQSVPSASKLAMTNDHMTSKNTAKAFGYSGGSFAKISSELEKALDAAARSTEDAAKKLSADVDSSIKAIEDKVKDTENASAPPGQNEWADAVNSGIAAVTGGGKAYAVCANAIAKHSSAKALGILGGLTRYYA